MVMVVEVFLVKIMLAFSVMAMITGDVCSYVHDDGSDGGGDVLGYGGNDVLCNWLW